jgi:hypothetical protein
MMKKKGKVPIDKQVEKLVKKILASMAKEVQRMMQLMMKMDPNKYKWVKKPVWGDFSTFSGLHHKKTY